MRMTHTSAMTGMPTVVGLPNWSTPGKPTVDLAKSVKALSRPEMLRASEISRITARTMVIMPMVAMKGGSLPSWMSTPLMMPATAQERRATKIARKMFSRHRR